MQTSERTNCKVYENNYGLPYRGHLQQKVKRTETLHQGAGGSITALQGTGATGKPAIEDSTTGRNKLVVRHLPVVNIRALSLSRAGSSGTLQQGAGSTSIPAEGEGLRQIISGVGSLHLANSRLSQ